MKAIVNGIEIDLTAEEISARESEIATYNNGAFARAIESLREKRNKLLADSDWEVIMAKEKGTTLSTAFKTYRQDLRDLTNGLTTKDEVNAVTFPTKP